MWCKFKWKVCLDDWYRLFCCIKNKWNIDIFGFKFLVGVIVEVFFELVILEILFCLVDDEVIFEFLGVLFFWIVLLICNLCVGGLSMEFGMVDGDVFSYFLLFFCDRFELFDVCLEVVELFLLIVVIFLFKIFFVWFFVFDESWFVIILFGKLGLSGFFVLFDLELLGFWGLVFLFLIFMGLLFWIFLFNMLGGKIGFVFCFRIFGEFFWVFFMLFFVLVMLVSFDICWDKFIELLL